MDNKKKHVCAVDNRNVKIRDGIEDKEIRGAGRSYYNFSSAIANDRHDWKVMIQQKVKAGYALDDVRNSVTWRCNCCGQLMTGVVPHMFGGRNEGRSAIVEIDEVTEVFWNRDLLVCPSCALAHHDE